MNTEQHQPLAPYALSYPHALPDGYELLELPRHEGRGETIIGRVVDVVTCEEPDPPAGGEHHTTVIRYERGEIHWCPHHGRMKVPSAAPAS